MRPDVKMSKTMGERGGRSTRPGKTERWYVLCSLNLSYSWLRLIVVPGASETCPTRFWIVHDDTSNVSLGLAPRRMRVISCEATIHALQKEGWAFVHMSHCIITHSLTRKNLE